MTAPIVAPETTLRELGEILREHAACVSAYPRRDGGWAVGLIAGGPWSGADDCDLAAAINDALVKAGAR